MTEMNAKFLLGNPEGKKLLRELMRGAEDNIKMDFREIRYCCVAWIHLAQDRD
jgi:hypothetical protein